MPSLSLPVPRIGWLLRLMVESGLPGRPRPSGLPCVQWAIDWVISTMDSPSHSWSTQPVHLKEGFLSSECAPGFPQEKSKEKSSQNREEDHQKDQDVPEREHLPHENQLRTWFSRGVLKILRIKERDRNHLIVDNAIWQASWKTITSGRKKNHCIGCGGIVTGTCAADKARKCKKIFVMVSLRCLDCIRIN